MRRLSNLDRLWVRLLLAFAIVLGVAVGTAAIYAQRETQNQFHSYVNDSAANFNQRVGNIVGRVFLDQGWPGVAPYIQRVAEESLLRIVIVDDRGNVVADTEGKLVGTPSSQLGKILSAPSATVNDANGANAGTIYFVPPDEARSQIFLADTDRALAVGVGLGVLVALILSLLLARWIVKPIERLIAMTQKLEQGDLTQRVDKSGSGELSKLAHAFNAMAEALERARHLRQNLVADIAHELRTPLHNVLGYLEMLRDGITDRTPDMVSNIYDEAFVLKRLVDDLQQVAIIESGHLQLLRQSVSPSAFMHQALVAAQPAATERGIALIVDVDTSLPEVFIDEARIRQVLGNLISNALAATPSGGQISLFAHLTSHDKHVVEIVVADNGKGIVPSDVPYVFERFYRADQSRSRSTGGGWTRADDRQTAR